MQQGGIYNAALFGASQRDARGKLDQMAGIKRSGPSGILASSTQLMNAAAPAMLPKQPMPMPMPQAMPAPAPMPMPQAMPTPQPMPTPQAAAGLPQVPMQTAVSARPPAPVPTVPQPASPLTPMKFQDAGPVDIREQAAVNPMAGLGGMPPWMADAVKKFFGSEEAAAATSEAKAAQISESLSPDSSAAEISDVVLQVADEAPTDDAKRDFARNVFNLEDVSDIDEIDRRIADVALASSIGKGPEAFSQALLLGLNNYKQTAAARAAAASDSKSGGSFLSTTQGEAALDLYLKRIENNESPSEVEQMMNEQIGNNIGTKVRIAVAGGVTGSPAPTGQGTDPEVLLQQARDSIKRGAPLTEVQDKLRELGVDPGSL